MGSIGSRLREERERLGYSQSDLAELGGSTRKSEFNYETDARRPDADYLVAIAAAGVNILYVLTGNNGNVQPPDLTTEERQLLEHYRDAPAAVRKAALGALMSAVADTPPKTKGRRQAGNERSSNDRGQIANDD